MRNLIKFALLLRKYAHVPACRCAGLCYGRQGSTGLRIKMWLLMFYVYVIVSNCKGLRFYVGMTSNFERRIIEHNNGHQKSTKAYIPWQLVQIEEFKTRKEAREREKYWKSGTGRERIRIKHT